MAGAGVAREGPVAVDDIRAAAARVRGLVRETPLLPAGELSRRAGAPVTLKAESLQRTGSFKLRGAANKLLGLDRGQLGAGVVAASAGNHAQAVALAARHLGAEADLFIPAGAPLAKIAAVRAYGGRVHPVDGSYDDAAVEARRSAGRKGRTLIPPFDDPAIIAGAGTVGLEIARQAPRTRLVVVPIGGGALAAGVAIALKQSLADVRAIGVQAEACAPLAAAHRLDRPAESGPSKTICDGIAVKRPGRLTRPLIERWIDDIVTVSDDEVARAMVILLERSKLVAEGAGAASVAALMAGRVEPPEEGEICAVVSGGNVDASRLTECIRLAETAAERRLTVDTVVPDRPGALAGLLRVLAEQGANVLDVTHVREGMSLHIGETAVRLVLETKGHDHSQQLLGAVQAEGFRTSLPAARGS